MNSAEALGFAQSACFFTLLFVAGVTDLRECRIRNWLVAGGTGVGFLLALARGVESGNALSGLYGSGGGVITALVFFLPIWWLGGVGAGDAKLMAAVGALTSWRFVLWATACTAFAGAILAIGFTLWRGNWREAFFGAAKMNRTERRQEIRNSGSKRTIPYGVAIAIGGVWAVVEFIRRGMVLPWETLAAA